MENPFVIIPPTNQPIVQLTPFQRACQNLQYQSEMFDKEQEEFNKGEDHQAEFRQLMRAAGRTQSR